MSHTEIAFRGQAREQVPRGTAQLADIVGITLRNTVAAASVLLSRAMISGTAGPQNVPGIAE